METLGDKIFYLRKQAGVSQEDLGFEINVSRQTISKWESNLMNPTTDNIKSLCKYFNISIDYFFEENDNSQKSNNAEVKEEIVVADVTEQQNKTQFSKHVVWIVAIILSSFISLVGLICGTIFMYLNFKFVEGDEVIRTLDFDVLGILCFLLALLFIITLVVLVIYRSKFKK